MNFDGSRCGNCNKEIYQSQRFCDKCGNRLDHSIDEVKLPKGKIKRSSRYNVLTFFGCCGANNEPVIADTTIRENLNRDISWQSKHKADQDTREPQDIDIVNVDGNEHISLSAIKEIHTDTNLQSEQHGFQKEGETESSIDFTGLSSKKDIQTDECFQSPSAIKEILTDEDLQSEHERLQEPGDIETSIEHGSSDKEDIQKDGCLQSEHDEHKDPRNSECSLEHGLSSKKDIQTDECLQSEYNGCKEPQDKERSIEKGPSASEEIQTDKHLQSEHERLRQPVDIDSFIEHGSSAIKEIQTDKHLQSEHDGLQKPDDIESSIEHGPSAVKDIHTYESVQSEHDGLQKQIDIDSSNEDGLSSSKEIQTDGNLQSVYGRLQEPGDIKSSIEHGPSNKKEIQADICLESEQAGHKKPRDIESSLEHGSFTENDIQREQYVQSEHDGLHDYIGNIESSTENEADFQKLYANFKEYGFMKTTAYFRKKLNEVNTEIIKLAVIGRSAVGKSSFINMMLDLKEGTKCFAETGSGDTTQEMIVYKHPKNENITFWDMPGFGTIDMPKDKFTSEFGPHLHTFDYFFIFIDTVIMEADLWLVNHIQGFCTPYCLVRSKVDEDVKKGRTKEVIRQKLKRSIETNDIVKGSALFLISNVKSYCHTGDLRELFAHITKKLPKAKGESLAFFLELLTPELIEKNFKSLQKRIQYIAFTAGVISAVPIPLVDIPVNIYMIGTEIEKYYRIFLLDKDIAQNVPGVKNKKLSKHSITQSAITFFKAVTNVTTVGTVIMSQADIMVPGAGSVAAAGTTFTYASHLLSNKLKEMKNDALSVYEYYAVGK